MANATLSTWGIPIKLIGLADGSYAISCKQVSAGNLMAAGDKAISAFGINKPIWFVSNNDGVNGANGTYSLAVATPTTPRPGNDIAASIFGTNLPIRLVWIASANAYALGVNIN